MFTKLKRKKEVSLLQGNKTPNPTNFSNSRSQRYLNPPDAENHVPNQASALLEPIPRLPRRSHDSNPGGSVDKGLRTSTKGKGMELRIEDPFGTKERVSTEKSLMPLTSKPAQCKLQSWDSSSRKKSSAERVPFGTCRLEKLSPKELPAAGDADIINSSLVTIESCVETDRDGDCGPKHPPDQYPVLVYSHRSYIDKHGARDRH